MELSHDSRDCGAGNALAAAPFAVRLTLARQLVRRREVLPLHLADQLEAAIAETAAFVPAIGRSLSLGEPSRGWRQRVEAASDDKAAYLLAALIGCMDGLCPHLRTGGPQPAFARLALRRLDCRRCSATLRRPPPGHDHLCDVCGEHQARPWFVPFVIGAGATLFTGDACGNCAALLGIGERVVAS